MDKDIAQLIARCIDDQKTLFNFALVNKTCLQGVRNVAEYKKITFKWQTLKKSYENNLVV
jgi:hypothetical protein